MPGLLRDRQAAETGYFQVSGGHGEADTKDRLTRERPQLGAGAFLHFTQGSKDRAFGLGGWRGVGLVNQCGTRKNVPAWRSVTTNVLLNTRVGRAD